MAGCDKGANLILFGPPGGGKSHLVLGDRTGLLEKGWRVLFTRTSDLVQKLQVARREFALEAAIQRLDRLRPAHPGRFRVRQPRIRRRPPCCSS